MRKILIILLGFISYGIAMEIGLQKHEEKTESQKVIDSLDEEDRAEFVTFHIEKVAIARNRNDVIVIPPAGERITEEKYEYFETIEVPEYFSEKLFDWTEAELALSAASVINRDMAIVYAREYKLKPIELKTASGIQNYDGLISADVLKLCFPSGCVDPNDVGQSCCPF